MTEKVMTVLLGSPRTGGNTEKLSEALTKEAAKKGYEIRIVRLSGMELKGCTDCRKCWSKDEPCVIDDDMGLVYKDLEDAEIIVFASPLYFYSWSAQIKPVWDRLLPYNMPNAPRGMKGKKAILLAAAGDGDPSCFEGMEKSFKISCKFMSWEVAGEILAAGIYGKGEMESKGQKYLKEAKELGTSL